MLTSTLKVGDEAAYKTRSWDSYVFSVVKKISPTGQITLENGAKFSSRGRGIPHEAGHGTYLCDPKEARERIAELDARHARCKRAKAIAEFVESKKQGSAFSSDGPDYPFTAADKAKLLELVNEIETVEVET